MKIITRLIITLLLAAIVVFVALWILLQTQWGTRQLSDYLNKQSSNQLQFSSVSYSLKTPWIITLNQFTMGERNKPPYLTTGSTDLELSTRQLSEPGYLQSITLRNGRLDLASAASSAPGLRADTLRLDNMQVTDTSIDADASGVTATFAPWLPISGKPLGANTRLQSRAASLTIQGMTAQNVLAQGTLSDRGITLTTINAKAAGGNISGALQRYPDGRWRINEMLLEALRLQTDKELRELLTPLIDGQPVMVDAMTVTNARLEGKDWAVTDLNLKLDDITFGNGGWQSENGQLSAHASEAVISNSHIITPELSASFSPEGIALRQATARWEGGNLRTQGQWIRNIRQLDLTSLTIDNLEYTLPAEWKGFLNTPLPDWLNRLTVQQLTASRNLIIDIDKEFPWQITALQGQAQGLELVQHQRWGVWNGRGEFSAPAATFNRTDMLSPAIGFNADSRAINISKLTGVVDKGQLGATATISQDSTRQTHLELRGEGIAANVLKNWGWPEISAPGAVNLTLSADASLAAGQPLRPGVNARLELNGSNGLHLNQVMSQGRVAP